MNSDTTQRFLFDDTNIRGELVQLQDSYLQILQNHNYPDAVAELLGEFLVASVLLSSTIKFEGRLILQARSKGEIPLIMSECTDKQVVRGIAHMADEALSDKFSILLRDGTLAITIEPLNGEPYQGIVPLNGKNLAECLEFYFAQSEQLATEFYLAANSQNSTGLMIQQLPADSANRIDVEDSREQQWLHISQLAKTITYEELLSLDREMILYRLYHQVDVRLFNAFPVTYKCSCSRNRTGGALLSIGRQEVEDILASEGEVNMTCEFCNQNYHFDDVAIAELFDGIRSDSIH